MIRASKQILPLTIYDLETLPVWTSTIASSSATPCTLWYPSRAGLQRRPRGKNVLATLLARFPTHPHTTFQLFQDLRHDRVRKAAEAARAQGKRQYSTSPTGAKIGHIVLNAMAFFCVRDRPAT